MVAVAAVVGRARGGGLDHPNIVRVLDGGEYGDGGAYVVMELIEGRSLADCIAQDGPLPWSHARAVLLQITDALAAAHTAGVVHRDLKPANILVSAADGALHCKVIDFGLARPTGVDPSTGKLTGTGLVFGTPRYMSPEQIRAEIIDARADVYALGCLAYEMLTGTPAVASDTIADVLIDHLYCHPRNGGRACDRSRRAGSPTVRSATPRSAAISAFESPAAAVPATARSESVSEWKGVGSAGLCPVEGGPGWSPRKHQWP